MPNFLLLTLMLAVLASSARADHGARQVATALTNAEAALSTLYANPPLPMTYFRKGDYKIGVLGDFFSVTKPAADADAPVDVSKDGSMIGWGGGGLFDYAFSDRWSVYGMLLGARLNNSSVIGTIKAGGNADTLLQRADAGAASSVAAAAGLNGRLLGDSPDGFTLTGFLGPVVIRTKGSGAAAFLSNQPANAANSTACPQSLPGYVCVRRNFDATLTDIGIMGGFQATVPLGTRFSLNPYVIGMGGTFSGPSSDAVNLDQPTTFGTDSGGTATKSKVGVARGIPALSLGANLTYRPWSLTANLTGSFLTPLTAPLTGLTTFRILTLQISKSFGSYRR